MTVSPVRLHGPRRSPAGTRFAPRSSDVFVRSAAGAESNRGRLDSARDSHGVGRRRTGRAHEPLLYPWRAPTGGPPRSRRRCAPHQPEPREEPVDRKAVATSGGHRLRARNTPSVGDAWVDCLTVPSVALRLPLLSIDPRVGGESDYRRSSVGRQDVLWPVLPHIYQPATTEKTRIEPIVLPPWPATDSRD